jgi:signal transduction histidine kinase
MQKTFEKISFTSLTELFRNSEELLVAVDAEKNIVFCNKSAKNLFGDIKTITEIEHFFSFNVCVLDRDKFFNYNPIQEALSSKIYFVSETLYQVESNLYRNLYLRSFYIEDKKIIIFSDNTEKMEIINLRATLEENQALIDKLQKDNKEFYESGEKAQTFAIRAGLINKISNKIRDSIDIDEIISTAVEETSKTLGLSQGYFAEVLNDNKTISIKNSWSIETYKYKPKEEINTFEDELIMQSIQSMASATAVTLISKETGDARIRLATPIIYHNKVFAVFIFFTKKQWHAEEISLIEGIASQLASAINQANLFSELEKQKFDLENTLSELKETQAQLVQSEKMASLGQLVAGVAHEINTPIGSINSNNDIFAKCIQKIKDNPQKADSFTEIFDDTMKINTEAIKRINSIIKALKNFARLDEAEYKASDIHEGIRSTLMLINHELKGRIEVQEDFGKLPLINCYPNQLNQVFMNILVNACQSIETKGKITIKTESLDDKLKITISDTGKGISEENIKRIFDPGFTTKGVGVGTGLGLSICYRIVQNHKGFICAESKLGEGTTFFIELPIL